jgi:hypothetical protein
MNARHLPGNFASTGNALEMLAFAAKDAVFVVDDFAPQDAGADVARYHAIAAHLFRAAGNSQGRARLRSDATIRAEKPPRSLIIATGEDVCRGQSIRARTLILELRRGNIRPDALSECQQAAAAGHFATSIAGFIRWFAADFDKSLLWFRSRTADVRTQVAAAHQRTPGIIADLYAAFELFTEFAIESGTMRIRQPE